MSRTRAFIGRNLFEPSTFYRIIGDLNETLLEAIEILRDGDLREPACPQDLLNNFVLL